MCVSEFILQDVIWLSFSLAVISLPPPLERLKLYLFKWRLIKYWLHNGAVGCEVPRASRICTPFHQLMLCFVSSLYLYPSNTMLLCSPWSVMAPVLRFDVSLLLLLVLLLLLLCQTGVAVSEAQRWTWGVGVLAARGPRWRGSLA